MNPGAMKQTITVYEKAESRNATGYMDRQLAPLFSVRARRYDAGTREIWAAYAAKARNVVNFEIRYREGLRVGQIVRCQGQDHEIIAVQRMDELPARIVLKTVLKEPK